MFKDYGFEKTAEVRMDASAGKAMAERRGVGKVRHIATQFLWVQQRVKEGELAFAKATTTDNLADLMTKPLIEARIQYLLTKMNMHWQEGRCKLAPVLDG